MGNYYEILKKNYIIFREKIHYQKHTFIHCTYILNSDIKKKNLLNYVKRVGVVNHRLANYSFASLHKIYKMLQKKKSVNTCIIKDKNIINQKRIVDQSTLTNIK